MAGFRGHDGTSKRLASTGARAEQHEDDLKRQRQREGEHAVIVLGDGGLQRRDHPVEIGWSSRG